MSVNSKMTAIADGFRESRGLTGLLNLDQMAELARTKTDPTLQEIAVTENGTYTPGEGVDGFSKVTVAVESAGGGVNLFDYMNTFTFDSVAFETGTELDISLGKKSGKEIIKLATAFNLVTGLKSVKLSCNEQSTAIDWTNAFRYSSMETIDLTDFKVPIGNAKQIFAGSKAREILGELDFSNITVFNATFLLAYDLVTVRIKPNTIKANFGINYTSVLSDESIQSIIDGLADLTGGTAQTLTLHATVGAKLTDEQKAAASAKNWTISY